jgi:hypothetical protein
MRSIDAIFSAAGEAMRPFLQEAFDAGRAVGRKNAIDEYKARIAAIWDDDAAKSAPSPADSLTAAMRKLRTVAQ